MRSKQNKEYYQKFSKMHKTKRIHKKRVKKMFVKIFSNKEFHIINTIYDAYADTCKILGL